MARLSSLNTLALIPLLGPVGERLPRTKPFESVEAELATLARQRDDFRRIIAPEEDDPIFGLCSFLEAYDIRTAYPLLLAIMDRGVNVLSADSPIDAATKLLDLETSEIDTEENGGDDRQIDA